MLRGTVMPGGADWQIVRADGLAELDTRYTLRTDAGDIIYIQNAGIRHAPPEIVEEAPRRPGRRPGARLLPHRADLRDRRRPTCSG